MYPNVILNPYDYYLIALKNDYKWYTKNIYIFPPIVSLRFVIRKSH